ncbi:MAG: endonuclease domain-containing protein [Ignavibacteria bacterium]|nr:endonuclease domain-containing protein [Ignavibacteria bacterium]
MNTKLPYIPYNTALKERARELRNNLTAAERKLWFDFLRSHPLRWLRQKPLGNYIVDFYCSEKQVVIEVDGDSHFSDDAQEYDAQRTAFLNSYGLRVIRFTNSDVHERFEAVCEAIETCCAG